MRQHDSRLALLACVCAVALLVGGCAGEQGTAGGKSGALNTYVKGASAYRQGDKDQAIESLRAAIQENPQLIMPRIILGRIYKDKGEYASAAEYYESLTQLDPHEPEHFYNLGVSYQMLQRLQESAKSYQGALKLNPNDFGSNMNLGLVYLALGDVDKAVQYTQKAADLKPDSAEGQANLAAALDSKGEYAKAEIAYRKSLELAPGKSGTLINYASNLIAQGKSQDAIQVLQATLKLEDTPYLHKRMGDAYALGGKYEEAIVEYKVALKANPRYYGALNEQGRVLIVQYQAGMELEDKKRDEALGMWRQSLEISPDQPKIKAMLEQWEKRMFSK